MGRPLPRVVPIQRAPVGAAPREVVLAAYEVYTHLYGEQPTLVDGAPRGGFSVAELVAFLYARAFPRAEWMARVNEAMRGLDVAAIAQPRR
jgi:hypothetical protein